MCRSQPGMGYLRLGCVEESGLGLLLSRWSTTAAALSTATSTTTTSAYRTRRRVSRRLAVFSEATAAFGVESRILLAFDTSGLGLFISGGTIPETGGHVYVASEGIRDCHRSS